MRGIDLGAGIEERLAARVLLRGLDRIEDVASGIDMKRRTIAVDPLFAQQAFAAIAVGGVLFWGPKGRLDLSRVCFPILVGAQGHDLCRLRSTEDRSPLLATQLGAS